MSRRNKHFKVLIAKPGLDGHDRGALFIAQNLRDAGMEVVYTGIRQSPEDIVQTVMQEDVDVIGVSCLSGAHLTLCKEIMGRLRKGNMRDKIVFCGGIIPQEDHAKLKRMGIKAIFTPNASSGEIVKVIKDAGRRPRR